jgi:tetratricopeptide (TPR) repeat protein
MSRVCRRPVAAAALVLGLSCPIALAQDDAHASCGKVGWVPREILQRPVGLRANVGPLHDPVTTASPDAQALYDQGVAYLHSYVWIEAARSFNQALRADPGLAMAYLGLSRAYSGLEDPAAARSAADEARARAAAASPRERRRIELRKTQLDTIDDSASAEKHLAYKKAIDEALAAEMDDPELWLLRGNAEERWASGRGQRGEAASVAFYRQALALVPDHFAAHHYLIHSYENVGRIDDALVHGQAYARLASAIPHAHHMYAHDLRRVGRVDEAIAQFRRAYDMEKAYYAAENIPAGIDWHHPHNLDLLAGCHQHQGQVKTAEAYMRESLAVSSVMEGREFNRKEWPGFLLAFGRNEEALAAARELTRGRWPSTRVVGHVLAGHALAATRRLPAAREELAAADKGMDEVGEPGATARSAVDPYVDGLRGELLLREGRRAEAAPLLQDVQKRIRAVPGPDAWTEALYRLEAIARVAREAGDWDLAAYTAEQMRDHDPAYAGTRYALALVAEHGGDAATAGREFAAAVDLWKDADPDLAALRDARARAGRAAVAAPTAPGGPSR